MTINPDTGLPYLHDPPHENEHEAQACLEKHQAADQADLYLGRLVRQLWHGFCLVRRDDMYACYMVHNPDPVQWHTSPERALEAAGFGEDVEDMLKARGH